MITIVIAEDQRMLRGALSSLLDLEDDLQIIGQAANGKQALELIIQLKPDICLIDIEMPIKNGIEVAEEIKRMGSSCKAIILTTFARPGYFERAVKADVYGYLLKDGSSDDLAMFIRQAMEGKREFATELIIGTMKSDNPLTEREQVILKLVSQGKTNKDISSSLYLSEGTVRNYISEILNKLDAKNRIEAFSIAEQSGWI